MKPRDRRFLELRCSFCGKSRDKVKKLVAGPGVYICDQCIALCNQVIAEEPPPPAPTQPSGSGWIRRISGWRIHRVAGHA